MCSHCEDSWQIFMADILIFQRIGYGTILGVGLGGGQLAPGSGQLHYPKMQMSCQSKALHAVLHAVPHSIAYLHGCAKQEFKRPHSRTSRSTPFSVGSRGSTKEASLVAWSFFSLALRVQLHRLLIAQKAWRLGHSRERVHYHVRSLLLIFQCSWRGCIVPSLFAQRSELISKHATGGQRWAY